MIAHRLLDPDLFFRRARTGFIAGEHHLVDAAEELLLFGTVRLQIGSELSTPRFAITAAR